jgi:tRNA A-37 threonylcarbamoyl transferase component Bud32
MTAMTCPAEHELLRLLRQDAGASEAREHVASCSECRRRLEQLDREVRAIRENRADASLPPWSDLLSNVGLGFASARTDPDETADYRPKDPLPSTEQDPGPSDGQGPSEMPSRIDKYLVVGLLDDGGQATVYRVVHPGIGRDLALKISKKQIDERGAHFDLTAGEAKILGEIDHPGLVRVVDVGTHEGRMFLVMDYVRGRNLQKYAKDRPVTPREAAWLVIEVAQAAEAVHRRGIEHQDIKPKNILVDESGKARLIDFGLARWHHTWSQSAEGPSGGTPEFMAPEQAKGDDDRIGPRTDVFALGAVLYFLLTGSSPFQAGSQLGTLNRASRNDFDREALKKARVPRRLERIILKAMATEPESRHASADALARDLDSFVRRPRRLALAGAILCVAAASALGWARWPEPTFSSNVELQVFRGQTVIRKLAGALPLRTGDRVVVRCPVAHGSRAAIFWLDSGGHLTALSPTGIEPGKEADIVVYPAMGRAPLIGAPGTELVVVCARRSGTIQTEEAAGLIATVPQLPNLPSKIGVRLSRSSTELLGDRGPLGNPELDSVDAVCDALERLRRRLREKYDFIEGIAFPHVAAPSDSDSDRR